MGEGVVGEGRVGVGAPLGRPLSSVCLLPRGADVLCLSCGEGEPVVEFVGVGVAEGASSCFRSMSCNYPNAHARSLARSRTVSQYLSFLLQATAQRGFPLAPFSSGIVAVFIVNRKQKNLHPEKGQLTLSQHIPVLVCV